MALNVPGEPDLMALFQYKEKICSLFRTRQESSLSLCVQKTLLFLKENELLQADLNDDENFYYRMWKLANAKSF